MKRIPMKFLVTRGLVSAISKLRVNANGYFYLTCMKGNKSNNIYLSKNATAHINALGIQAGESVPAELTKKLEIVAVENEAKELRFKASFGNESSDYQSTTSLLELYGIEDKGSEDFPMEEFTKEFTAAPTPQQQEQAKAQSAAEAMTA